MAVICCYCGCNQGKNPLFIEKSKQFGKILAQQGHTLIYGGGKTGLMGVVADAVLAERGKVIGVIPELFLKEEVEVAHSGLTELKVVSSMHERKALMASLSDAFVALPGGIGTLEEIIEVFVWTQIGSHQKPCGLLNISQFYEPLTAFLESMVAHQFLRQEQLTQLLVEEDPEKMIQLLISSQPSLVKKWI
jgi:uncharacterized protein (TIGR00730 family)